MKTVLTLLAAAVIGIAGCNAAKVTVKPVKAKAVMAQTEAPPVEEKKPAAEDKKAGELGTVTAVGQTEKLAREVAQLKAREEVLTFLARQKPPVRWQPTLEFLQSHNFVRDEVMTVETARDANGKEVGGAQHWCTLRVDLSPALFTEILEEENRSIQVDRQWLAGKVLAVVLALVLALGGYFYLDEATKGFYTVMLRLGAITLVGVVSLAVWLVIR
jgi:hypothetical protein